MIGERNRSSRRKAGRVGLPSSSRVAIAGLLLWSVGCASRPAGPENEAVAPATASRSASVEEYFPLTAQSQWTYRIQDFARKWTYQSVVHVHGERFFEPLGRSGIAVEERYSGGGIFIVEEQEPILYFKENGFLNRIFLTYQADKLVAASGSGDRAFLPEVLRQGATWSSDTRAFQVGDLGFRVNHHHVVASERETVKVPAGTFRDCIRVDTSSTQGPQSGRRPGEELLFYYADWYAPGVGLVRTQEWDDEKRTSERARIELMRYSVAP